MDYRSNRDYDNAYSLYSQDRIPQDGQRASTERATFENDARIQPTPKRSNGWIILLIVVVCLCLTTMICVASCNSTFANLFSTAGVSGSSDKVADLRSPTIGVIDMQGEIAYDGSTCSPDGLKAQLDKAEKSNEIVGVILRVNSGGGTATAGEEMAKYVKDFEKPIVVTSAATNASAAYEISSQADYIFTDKTTSIGAIGVVLQVTDLSGLYDKLGINIESIKSTESKDSSFGNRALTEEERAWYQSMVDQIDSDFIATVAAGRNMSYEEVEKLANGLPYTGTDAVENGLADEIGTFEDALLYISKKAGYSESLKTVKLAPESSELMSLLSLLSEYKGELDAADISRLSNLLEEHRVVE